MKACSLPTSENEDSENDPLPNRTNG